MRNRPTRKRFWSRHIGSSIRISRRRSAIYFGCDSWLRWDPARNLGVRAVTIGHMIRFYFGNIPGLIG